MIASCCRIQRLSRQVLRFRDSAGVRYVCAPGHGCKAASNQAKTKRGKGHAETN